jgi:hypothetical protein
MADQKISQLSEATTLQNADVFAVAVDLATAPVTKKITLANLINLINKPAGSSGQVQFNNAGAFGGDNDLFWDNTNKRLGIGTTGPGAKLEVNGVTILGGGGTVIGGANTSASNQLIFSDTQGTEWDVQYAYSGLWFAEEGIGTRVIFKDGGNVGIGPDTTPDYLLDVQGTFNSDGETYLASTTGNVGIGTTSPTISDGVGLHLAGKILRVGTSKTPATAGAAGNAGEICWDADYVYLCIATNTWRRISHATW